MSPAAQAQLLQELAIQDAEVAEELKAMLAVEQQTAIADESPFDWPTRSKPLLIGCQFGPFCIESLISHGGMGSVYLAQRNDGRFEQTVAIKVIDSALEQLIGRQALLREAAVMARLNHPDIGKVFDAGIHADGHHYILMEYVAGQAIDQVAAAQQLNETQLLTVFIRLCRALDYAHSMQIVHADIKPSNIMLDEHLQVKVLDFGISRIFQNRDAPMSNIYQCYIRALTRDYASPELLATGQATPSSDIFALGKLLARLLTQSPAKPSRYRAELNAIIDKACAEQPLDRYTSVLALQQDIERYQGNFATHAFHASRWYRFNKLVRQRHPLLSGTIALALLCCSYLLINLITQYQQLKAAKLQSDLMVNRLSDIVQLANRRISNGDNFSAKDMLDNSAQILNADTELNANSIARIQLSLAQGYASIGDNDQAEQFYQSIINNYANLSDKAHAFKAGELWIRLLIRRNKFDAITPAVQPLLTQLQFSTTAKRLPATVQQAMFYHRYIDAMKWYRTAEKDQLAQRHIALLKQIKQHYWPQLTLDQQAEVAGFLGRAISFHFLHLNPAYSGRSDTEFEQHIKPLLLEAKSLLEQEHHLYQQVDRQYDVARSEFVLATLSAHLGSLNEAHNYGEHALALLQNIMGDAHPDLLLKYGMLSESLRLIDLPQSQRYAAESLALSQTLKPQLSSAQYINSYHAVLSCLYFQGDVENYQQRLDEVLHYYLTLDSTQRSQSMLQWFSEIMRQSLWWHSALPISSQLISVAQQMQQDITRLSQQTASNGNEELTPLVPMLQAVIDHNNAEEILRLTPPMIYDDTARAQQINRLYQHWLTREQPTSHYSTPLLASQPFNTRELHYSPAVMEWLIKENQIWQAQLHHEQTSSADKALYLGYMARNTQVVQQIIAQQQLPVTSWWRAQLAANGV
ncbi:serine/threonine protein kinase [Shewanella sp.]|uniref:serine/threonine protein kinase n=1 Tax=Shewanella sp. TaxID=50422 RepID=UPI003A9846EC